MTKDFPDFANLYFSLLKHFRPTPVNINYWWGFGSLAGIFLVVQLATGSFLAMHYLIIAAGMVVT